jgi:predicted RNA methylase
MGQYPTPPDLARDLVAHSLQLLPGKRGVRFLDPAFGTGPFFSALLARVPSTRLRSAEGYEVDPHYAEATRELWSDTGLDLRVADFTLEASPESEAARPNLVICNPPYVRHHHIDIDAKSRLREAVQEATGIAVDGRAGLYCYFLLLAHRWLATGGIGCWLLPNSFLYTDYGQAVRTDLQQYVTLSRIHRFSSDEAQFEDALVTPTALWFQAGAAPPGNKVTLSSGGSIGSPQASRRVPQIDLAPSEKWTKHFSAPKRGTAHDGPTLGDIVRVKRGLATGCNRFFILSPDEAVELNLPPAFLKPILPSPRHLGSTEIHADEAGMPKVGQQRLLLDCHLPDDVVPEAYPMLWEYLQRGIRDRVHERTLCRSRSPWYGQENRPPAPLVATYMARINGNAAKSYRFILNHSQATASNSYLMIYPRPWLASVGVDGNDVALALWKWLSETSADIVTREGREYSRGLHKLEPRELMGVTLEGDMAHLASQRDRQALLPM